MFNYFSGTNWTFYNPSEHTPPFLTNLVNNLSPSQFNDILTNCSNRLDCAYDLLVTNNSQLADRTTFESQELETEQSMLGMYK